jgi:hypothetical protein
VSPAGRSTVADEVLALGSIAGELGAAAIAAVAGRHPARNYRGVSRTRTGPLAWTADRLGIRRHSRVRVHARSYLAELLETNSMRVVNDFRDRVLESRRLLEAEVRRRLEEGVAVGERALENASRRRAAGEEAVTVELSALAAKRQHAGAIEAALAAPDADGQLEEVRPR